MIAITDRKEYYEDCVKWLQEIPCKGCIDPDREAQEEAEPMHYNYPRVKFVDSNTIYEQLKHVESELQEIKDASPGDQAWGEEWEKEVEEIIDLHHSVETCIRTLQEVYGVDIEKYRRAVIEKNRRRGYYDTTEADTASEAMARVAEHDGTADKMARGE